MTPPEDEKAIAEVVETDVDFWQEQNHDNAEWENHRHDCPCSDCWDPPTDD